MRKQLVLLCAASGGVGPGFQSLSNTPGVATLKDPATFGMPKFVPPSIQNLPELESDRIPDPVMEARLQPQRHRLESDAIKRRTKGYLPMKLQTRLEIADESEDKAFHRVTPEWFGLRLDEFLVQHYGEEVEYDTIKKMVQNGHIYRYAGNGRKKYSRVSDRLELDELVIVPKEAHWSKHLAPPVGVMAAATSERKLKNWEDNIKEGRISDTKENDDDHLTGSRQEQEQAKRERNYRIPISARMKEEAMSWVLFKNEHVVCINKPNGIPISGGKGVKISVTDMLSCWQYTKTTQPLVCNFLDKDTSGVVILARDRNAHRMLGRMFQRRQVPNNVFWAITNGVPAAKFGRMKMHMEVERNGSGDQIIARARATDKSRVCTAEFVSNFNVVKHACFVSLYPLTSQKHQLRVLCAHSLRCPIVGDGKYGGEAAYPKVLSGFLGDNIDKTPMHLHHRKIQLPYKKRDGGYITVTAPLPDHMKKTFKVLGIPDDVDDPLIPS